MCFKAWHIRKLRQRQSNCILLVSAERKRLALLNSLRHYLIVRREKDGSASKFEHESRSENEVLTSANDGGQSYTTSERKSNHVYQKTIEDTNLHAQVVTERENYAAITRIEKAQKQFAEDIFIRMEAIERNLSELIKRLPSVNK